MARIAITGGTGFVGTRIRHALAERGHEIVLVARGRVKPGRSHGVTFARADVVTGSGLVEALQGCEVVIHLVAVVRERGGQTFERVNHGGTENVVAAARQSGVRHLVHQSAIGVDPDPYFAYLASKWAGEQAVKASGIPHTIVRPSVIFGPGDGFFTVLTKLVRLAPVVPIVGDGQALFQPIAAADVGTVIAETVERGPERGRTYEIGGPEHLTYEQIVAIIRRTVWHLPQLVIHVPALAMLPPAFVMDRLLPHPPITPGQLRLLEKHNITRLDSVPAQFGFEPLAFSENADYLRDY